MTLIKLFGVIGQWLGLLFTLIGLVLFIIIKADLAVIFISAGCVFWGVATKLKYYHNNQMFKKYKKRHLTEDDKNRYGFFRLQKPN